MRQLNIRFILDRLNKFSIILYILFLIYGFNKFSIQYAFGYDATIKLYQTYSLIQNRFLSDEYVYPAEDIDPDYNFFPVRTFYYLNINGRHLGQYPIAFSVISAPFWMIAGPYGLYFINIIALAGILAVLIKYWSFTKLESVIALVATPLTSYAYEYSEVLSFLFFASLGLTLYFKGKGWRSLIVGGIFLGFSAWLRLETLPFLLVFSISILIVKKETVFSGREFKTNATFFTGVLIILMAFFIFNYWDYGHIFGNRYFHNVGAETDGLGPVKKISQIFVLFFGGFRKLGFFGFTPFFGLALFLLSLRKHRKNLSADYRILFWVSIIFLPFASFLVGTEAQNNWGPRYLALAIFPMILLAKKTWDIILNERNDRSPLFSNGFIYVSLFSFFLFSAWMTTIGITRWKHTTNHMKSISQIFNSVESDFRLIQSSILVYYSGTDYLSKKIFFAEDKDELLALTDLLEKKASGKTIAFYNYTIDQKAVEKEMVVETGWPIIAGILKKVTEIPEYHGLSSGEEKEYLGILEHRFRRLKKEEFPGVDVYLYEIR